jgi:hypothetical protein
MGSVFPGTIGENLLADGLEILGRVYGHTTPQVEKGLCDWVDYGAVTFGNESDPVSLFQPETPADFARDRDLSTATDFYCSHLLFP